MPDVLGGLDAANFSADAEESRERETPKLDVTLSARPSVISLTSSEVPRRLPPPLLALPVESPPPLLSP